MRQSEAHPRHRAPGNEEPVARLLTPPGRGGIAVIHLTGPGAAEALRRVFRPLPSHADAAPRTLQLGRIVGEDGAVLDEAVVCSMPEGIEINIHGGPQVVRSTLERLGRCGARVAAAPVCEGGGFPPAHPQLDNPAVGREMLEALSNAQSPLAVAALTHQWSAGLSRLASRALARVSAAEAPGVSGRDLADVLRRAAQALPRMARLLRPAEVVIVGPPNAGKSTLTNALVGRAVSIVHERAGTTRDWVRELALIDQAPVHVTDTAGLWQQAEGIDAEAVARARRCAEQADVILLTEGADGQEFVFPSWLDGQCVILVRTKADLLPRSESGASVECPDPQDVEEAVAVSALTGEGLPQLRRAILRRLGLDGFDPAEPMAFTPRQAGLLERAAQAMDEGSVARTAERLGELLAGPPADQDGTDSV